MCAFVNSWGSFRSHTALEGCAWYVCVGSSVGLACLADIAPRVLGMCASDMFGTEKRYS